MSYQMPPFTQYAILGENRIFGFPQKYHVKTTQDATQMTFRAFQAKLGPVNFEKIKKKFKKFEIFFKFFEIFSI